MRVDDDLSTGVRFNDEKSWVEFVLTRGFPMGPKLKSTSIAGLMKGVHSQVAYNRLEAASDGIVDIKVEEQEGEIRNLLRIRTLRNTVFDSRWHRLKINDNFQVTLDK